MAVEILQGNGKLFDPLDSDSLLEGSPIDRAIFVVGNLGTGGGGLRARILADFAENGVRLSGTVAGRIAADPHRFIPLSVIEQAIATGRTFRDPNPQGAISTIVFFTTTIRNNAEVGMKAVVDTSTNTIVHMHFDKPATMLRQLERAGDLFGIH